MRVARQREAAAARDVRPFVERPGGPRHGNGHERDDRILRAPAARAVRCAHGRVALGVRRGDAGPFEKPAGGRLYARRIVRRVARRGDLHRVRHNAPRHPARRDDEHGNAFCVPLARRYPGACVPAGRLALHRHDHPHRRHLLDVRFKRSLARHHVRAG